MKQPPPTMQIPYLKSSNFLRIWSGHQGQLCELEGVQLSSKREPPKLLHAAPKPAPARVEKEVPERKKKDKKSEDPYLNLFNAAFAAADAVSTFQKWLRSSPPPAPAAPRQAPPEPKTRASPADKVPPFDLQDIPKAMRKIGMPMAAKLQERWFAGEANYSLSVKDLQAELNQNGTPYAPAMVDATTIKMEWVLSFARAKEAFNELIQERLWKPEVIEVLRRKLIAYRDRRDINAWRLANQDFLAFHQKFQFQFIKLNSTWGQRIAQYLDGSATGLGVPDDLTGALGAFNIYAAVWSARLDDRGRCAFVEQVAIYVRDAFEFSDEQYLGHWSASHVAVVPAQALRGDWLKHPMVEGSIYDKDSVMYPVTNQDYRDWRDKHGQGGDFMIYTDRHIVKLEAPVRVEL